MFWAGEELGPGQGEILNWDARNMKKRLNRGCLPCAGRESSIKEPPSGRTAFEAFEGGFDHGIFF